MAKVWAVTAKILKTIVAVVCIAFFLYSMSLSVVDYFKYPKRSESQFEKVLSMRMPDVVLCNWNKVRKSQMELDPDFFLITGGPEMVPGPDGQKRASFSLNEHEALDQHDQIIFNQILGSTEVEQLSRLGHQFDDTIFHCAFKGNDCNVTRDFYQLTDRERGNCFVFTPPETFKAESDNIVIIFNFEAYESNGYYIQDVVGTLGILQDDPEPQEEDDSPTMKTKKRRTFLSQTEKQKMINFSPGQVSWVNLALTRSEYVSPPYGTCNQSVSQADTSRCIYDCEQQRVVSKCHCTADLIVGLDSAPGTLQRSSVPRCTSLRDKVCASQVFFDFTPNSCGCPSSCLVRDFDRSISYSSLPSPASASMLLQLASHKTSGNPNAEAFFNSVLNNSDDDESIATQKLKSTLGAVIIKLQSLGYEKTREYPLYPGMQALLSAIGGLLGLYLGLSLMGIVGVLDSCIYACQCIVRYCKEGNGNNGSKRPDTDGQTHFQPFPLGYDFMDDTSFRENPLDASLVHGAGWMNNPRCFSCSHSLPCGQIVAANNASLECSNRLSDCYALTAPRGVPPPGMVGVGGTCHAPASSCTSCSQQARFTALERQMQAPWTGGPTPVASGGSQRIRVSTGGSPPNKYFTEHTNSSCSSTDSKPPGPSNSENALHQLQTLAGLQPPVVPQQFWSVHKQPLIDQQSAERRASNTSSCHQHAQTPNLSESPTNNKEMKLQVKLKPRY